MSKQYPEPVVGCFILNDKNELLLVKSYKWPGVWVVMGGHVEMGETIAQTCERECLEEVGLDVKFDQVLEPVEFIYSPDFHAKKHFIGLQSVCRVVGSTKPVIDNDEIQEARWFPLTEAAELKDVLPATLATISKIIEKRFDGSNH